MAKRRATKPKSKRKPRKRAAPSEPPVELPHDADAAEPGDVLRLGPLAVDDSKAAEQMRELAVLYEDVNDAQRRYVDKSEQAKTAKKTLEAATNVLLEKVREYTHPSPAPLPLFDSLDDAEHATQDMEAAAASTEPVLEPGTYRDGIGVVRCSTCLHEMPCGCPAHVRVPAAVS